MIRAHLLIRLPGRRGVYSPDVIFSDLARKLREINLESGEHEIIVLQDGTVLVNGIIEWQPKMAVSQKVS